ncbi:hypothetical protein WN51_12741 [Melipona quadrifasciata]|uniref:Uncharacterized protein n=1 Tax=Melipona quadrifasciata TaxID=166423 RepID=A0A0M9A2E7_9HYME|nr:hypothetical protein WN51_12741 [Melipona quadrifasciata]
MYIIWIKYNDTNYAIIYLKLNKYMSVQILTRATAHSQARSRFVQLFLDLNGATLGCHGNLYYLIIWTHADATTTINQMLVKPNRKITFVTAMVKRNERSTEITYENYFIYNIVFNKNVGAVPLTGNTLSVKNFAQIEISFYMSPVLERNELRLVLVRDGRLLCNILREDLACGSSKQHVRTKDLFEILTYAERMLLHVWCEAGSYPEERGPVFIGDLIAGQRYADETVFRRVIEFNNPTNTVQGTTLDVSVSSGAIHYISARNVQGSQAVVCGNSNALGASKTSISLRVPPNSLATLNMAFTNQTNNK